MEVLLALTFCNRASPCRINGAQVAQNVVRRIFGALSSWLIKSRLSKQAERANSPLGLEVRRSPRRSFGHFDIASLANMASSLRTWRRTLCASGAQGALATLRPSGRGYIRVKGEGCKVRMVSPSGLMFCRSLFTRHSSLVSLSPHPSPYTLTIFTIC